MKTIIEQSVELWTQDAEKALVKPFAKATSIGSQASLQAGPFTLQSDLPFALGGENKAASPIALMLAALSGCAVLLIRDTFAPQFGVCVDSVEAEASCTLDYRGLVGMPGAVPDMQNIEIKISVQSPDSKEKIDSIYQAWLERCPVYLSLIKPVEVSSTLVRIKSQE